MVEGEDQKGEPPQAKIEYDRLFSFLKYLITIVGLAITLIFSVAAYFTGKSVNDIKAEANSAIAAATQRTSAHLERVKEEARDIALGEARRQVQSAFEQANVAKMVEDAAQRKVGALIDRQIKQEVAQTVVQLQNEIAEIGEIADPAMQARVGRRRGLDTLARMAVGAKTERGRAAALSMHEKIISDYRELYDAEKSRQEPFVPPPAFDSRKQIAYEVKEIRSDTDLNWISECFIRLERVSGVHFKVLDFAAVEKWCKSQKDLCK
jgi:hypothetical protein